MPGKIGYNNQMNIQSMKYLAALAKYTHFGKAAKKCFVSQPTLSMQIKKLEDRLGVQLLERTNKSVRLTEAGVQMAEHAFNVLREVDAMKEKAQAMKDPFTGQVNLGIIPTCAPYFLPLVFPSLSELYPNLKIFLTEAQTPFLLDELKSGKLDIAIMGFPVKDSHLNSEILYCEELLLALPKNHNWSNKKNIDTKELSGENLLLLTDGHCLRDQALSLCEENNAQEIPNFKATSLETLRHMVASGIGMTLMPQLACRKDDGLTYIHFQNEEVSRQLGLVWRRASGRSLLFKDLIKQIKKIMTGVLPTS